MDISIIDIIEDNNERNGLVSTKIVKKVDKLEEEMQVIKKGMADIREMLISITKKEEEKKEE